MKRFEAEKALVKGTIQTRDYTSWKYASSNGGRRRCKMYKKHSHKKIRQTEKEFIRKEVNNYE